MEGYFSGKGSPQGMEELARELEGWFSVSGDMDDFIFYGETGKAHSER